MIQHGNMIIKQQNFKMMNKANLAQLVLKKRDVEGCIKKAVKTFD